MKNDTCIICQNTFTPREKKLYCSPSCKQQAHESKKVNELVAEPKTEPIKLIKYRFKQSEYDEYIEKYPNSGINNILEFFFFRKNLSGNFNIDRFNEYIKHFVEDQFFESAYHEPNSTEAKAFNDFKKTFHSDETEVNIE